MQATREHQFTEMYRRHHADVLAYFLRRTSSPEARDGAAEVFAVAWRRFDDVPTQRTLPWLFGVASNVLANQRRSSSRRAALGIRLNSVAWPRPASPDTTVTQAEADQALHQALASLSGDDREILMLNAWEGLPASDLADRYGISIAAAEKRLTRAKARLARALDDESDSPRAATLEWKGGRT